MLRLIQSRGLFVSTTVGGRHRLIHGLANRQPHGLRNGLVVKRKVELVNRAVTSKGSVAYVHSSSYRPTLLNPQQFQAVASNIKGSAALQSSCNNIRNSYKNDSVVRTNSLGSNSTSTTVSAAPTEKLSAANLPTEEQRNLLKDLILAASSVKSDSYSVSNNYVAAVLHLLYNLNSDFVADNETTRSVWLLLKRTGTDEHLKKFRLFIQSSNNFHSGTSDGNGTSSTITGFSSDVHGEASHGRQFTFSMKEIDEIIAYNLQKSKVQEAVFWYQIGQENYQLTPTKNTFNMLIPATVTKLNSWDTYYYLYNSMKSSGYELDKKRLEIVLTAACARPHYRWRDIISVLMDVVNSNSTEEAHYSLSSAVLERAFDALLIADRPAEMRQLYFDLSSSISRSKKDSKASSESDSSAKVSIPLRAARLSKSLYLAALLLDDIILIKTVFRNCNKLNYQRGNNNALVSSNSADSELILKELTAALLDIAKQNRRINGYDFGIALVLNLLNGNVKEVAHLWNSLIVRIIDDKNVTNSIQVTNVPSNLNPNSADGISDANNKDSTNIQSVKIPIDNIRELSNLSSMDDAVSVLTLLSNAILSCSMNGDQLRSAKDFLNQVLFMSDETFGDRKVTNLSTNAMTPDESTYDISSNNSRYNTDIISLHSELQYTQYLVEELTQTFGTLKDSKAASKLLISALQQQVLLSDDSLTTVMQLLQHDGDDELVLDCFKLYQQNIGNRQRNNQSDTQNSKKNSRTRHQRNISSHSAKVPCPQIYYHAIKSLNKLGMVDDIIVMLEEHMPSRGYTPTSAIYLLLLDALYKQKRYTEAVQLFHFTLKDDSARNSKRNEKDSSVTVRYEFFSDKNFQVALQCCAAGRLGLQAIELFQLREEMYSKGMLVPDAKVILKDVESVIVSLASAEFSSAIEPFLRSLCTLERPVAVTKHLALLSAVACASANDQKSLQQVLQLGGISAEEFDSNYQKIAGSYFR